MYVCMYEYTYAYVSSKKGAYLEFHRTDRSPESQWSKIREKCNLQQNCLPQRLKINVFL